MATGGRHSWLPLTVMEYLSFQQAIDRHPWLTERYLRRLVAERRIAFHKIGGRLVFAVADLDALVAAHRVEALR
jgi:hypothetical protein